MSVKEKEMSPSVMSLLFFLISVVIGSESNVVYVSNDGIDDPTCLNGGSQSCANLTLVLDRIRHQNNAAVYIEPGHYDLSPTVRLTFEQVQNISITSTAIWEDEGMVDISCQGTTSGLSFSNCTNVTIAGLSFIGCGMEHNSTSLNFKTRKGFLTFFAALYFEGCSFITLNSVSVSNSLGIAVQFYYTPNVNIINSDFINNTLGMYNISGGVYIEFPYCFPGKKCNKTNIPTKYVTNSQYIISGCNFINNEARNVLDNPNRYIFPVHFYHVAFGHGGGLSVFFKGDASDCTVIVEDCTFTNNTAELGGGAYFDMQDSSNNNHVIMSGGNVFNGNNATEFGGGAYLSFIFAKKFGTIQSCSYNISGTLFHGNNAVHGGGLYYYTTRQDCDNYQLANSLELINCTWSQNKAQSGAGLHLFAFHAIEEGVVGLVSITSAIFEGNVIEDLDRLDRKGLSFGALFTDKVPICFHETATFRNTKGTSLIAFQSKVSFSDDVSVSFISNSGIYGGAIALYFSTVMLIHENVTLEFINNAASSLGGAIYVENVGQGGTPNTCFLQYYDFRVLPRNWAANFIFKNNKADNVDNSIYSSSIDSCILGRLFGVFDKEDINDVFCWNGETALWEYNNHTDTQTCMQQIVTAPARLISNYSISNPLQVIPGKKVHMGIVAEDDQGQDVTSNLVLHATSHSPQEVSIDRDINYISNNELILYKLSRSVTNVTISLNTVSEVLQQVQIYAELMDCPPGLNLNANGRCSCVGDFSDRVECYDSTFSSFLLRGYWIGQYKGDTVVGHCRNCKYLSESVEGRFPLGDNFSYVDDILCGEHQNGTLCSSCAMEGYAPAINFDEFNCVDCSSTAAGISLFIFLDIIMPFALLVAIFFSDVPLTSGLLHGPILFGQMITTVIPLDGDGIITYESIFNQKATVRAEKVYFTLYDIFNAEFFMSFQNFCVSKNLSYAGIISLQYLSAFLPFVFVVLVALVYYCEDVDFSKICCHRIYFEKPNCLKNFSWASRFKNSPNALATFILLSYTKIAVITGYLLTPANLWTANVSTSYSDRLVMYLDGTIDYDLSPGSDYLVFFLLAIFLGIPFLLAVPLFLFCFRANNPMKNGGFFNHLLQQFQKELCENLDDFAATVKDDDKNANSQDHNEKDHEHIGRCCHVKCLLSKKNNNCLCKYQQLATKYCIISFYTEWSRHDFRWLAGGFFILRLILILPYMVAYNVNIQYILQFTVCMISGVAIIALRPYKRKVHKYIDPNAVEAGSLLLLALLIAISMYQYTYSVTGIQLSQWAYVLQSLLVWLPLIWFVVIYIRLFKERYSAKLIKCYKSCKKSSNSNVNPVIINNPNIQESLLK